MVVYPLFSPILAEQLLRNIDRVLKELEGPKWRRKEIESCQYNRLIYRLDVNEGKITSTAVSNRQNSQLPKQIF